MSRIFGIYGEYSQSKIDRVKRIFDNPLFEYNNENMYVASEGNSETTFYLSRSRTFICGIGIKKNSESYQILNSTDWGAFIDNGEKKQSLNGHFIGLKCNDDSIEFFNDTHAQRDILIYKFNDLYVFSTSIELLAKYVGGLEFDFDVLSQLWQMPNILNYDTIYKNVYRLGVSKDAKLSALGFSKHDDLYNLPSNLIDDPTGTRKILSLLLTSPIHINKKPVLALSGGLDSRLLLSVLLGSGVEFGTVSFGNKNHPDNLIAKEISNELSIPFENFDIADMSTPTLVDMSRNYMLHSQLLTSASSFKQFSHYSKLNEKGYFIIDGGWGEIARRGFYNALLLRSKNNLSKGNSEIILRYLRQPKPPIFNQEITEKMRNISIAALKDTINQMPDITKIGAEKWLDLFAIRTKLPNVCSFEQSRIDNFAMSFTPFVQPDFINYIQSIPLFYKKDAREFKQIISDLAPKLTEFPLVKGENYYPYKLKTLHAKILVKLKKKLKMNYNNNNRTYFAAAMKEFVMDTIESSDYKNYDAYHHKMIEKTIDEHYSGDANRTDYIDWFISFELLRQSIGKN